MEKPWTASRLWWPPVPLTAPRSLRAPQATRPVGSSEPHGSLIVGSLYDNVRAPLAFRRALSSPPRWMGFNSFVTTVPFAFPLDFFRLHKVFITAVSAHLI